MKLLGSGSQATFHLECKDRQALVQFSSFLGPPAACHYVPQGPLRHGDGHGSHVSTVFPRPKRRKGPSQLRHDQAWASAHKEEISQQVENTLLLPPPTPPSDAQAGQSPAAPASRSSPLVSTPSMSHGAAPATPAQPSTKISVPAAVLQVVDEVLRYVRIKCTVMPVMTPDST